MRNLINPRNVTRVLWASAYFVVGAELIVSSVVQIRKVLTQ